jgi:2-amino-4-hydroxy-6-hydroxymethyldihydropteridine diphosphokinase
MLLGAPHSPIDAVVGLGSNLGDRRSLLAGAVRSLDACSSLQAVSSVYETLPIGPEQPLFLNAAVRLTTADSPEQLLARMLEIERAAGRVRRERWGPRTLDLDLLWIDGVVVDSASLTVPHPELLVRAFALLPMVEVAPLATDPRTGRAYVEAVGEVDRGGVKRLSEALDWRTKDAE